MNTPTTPPTLDAPWLNDTERDDALQLLTRLDTLRQERAIPETALTALRAEDLVLSRVLARRLEQRLYHLLDQPASRIPGAFVDAVGRARDRYRKALASFEETHPAPPESDDPSKRVRVVHPVFGDKNLVAEILDLFAPDLEPFEDLSVTGYFLQKYIGPEPKFELPPEAYQNIQRVPGIGHPIDPMTGENILTQKEKDRLAYAEKRRKQKEAEQQAEERTRKVLAEYRATLRKENQHPEEPTPNPPPPTQPTAPAPAHHSHSSHPSHNAHPGNPTPGNANLPIGSANITNPNPPPPTQPTASPPTHHSHSSHSSHPPNQRVPPKPNEDTSSP